MAQFTLLFYYLWPVLVLLCLFVGGILLACAMGRRFKGL